MLSSLLQLFVLKTFMVNNVNVYKNQKLITKCRYYVARFGVERLLYIKPSTCLARPLTGPSSATSKDRVALFPHRWLRV